jgi:hypothetical protein
MAVKVSKKKKVVPPPGRKLPAPAARALANKQFGKTLARLAK